MKDGEVNQHAIFREASEPSTPANRLIELAKNELEIVRGAVALNLAAPEEALDLLKADKSDHVKDCLRQRETFRKLSNPLSHPMPPITH